MSGNKNKRGPLVAEKRYADTPAKKPAKKVRKPLKMRQCADALGMSRFLLF